MEATKQEQFQTTWGPPADFLGELAVVNNQPLGKRYMVTALVFFFLGGLLAVLMRLQLAVAENDFLGPEVYNRLFTMHGSTMMFLFAVPFLEGLAIYLLPLMIGSRDLAFPRLSAFGYWTYLFGGVVFYASFLFDLVPDAGWFAYTPLSGSKYSGPGTDFWVLGLGLVEVGGIAAGIEIIITVLKFRAPGMTFNRIPIFVWAMWVVGFMIVVAFTVLFTTTLMLELDRTLGFRFFDPDHGGSSLLWQHLFWFFGHPEVYIMFLPATGIVSVIVPVFARKPLAGYTLVVVAIVVTGFVSFGLWVHHMFTTGLPKLAYGFFTVASFMIALASGTQIFAWIATLWGGRPVFRLPMLWIAGFFILFLLGGFTGVMVAVVPFDWQVHDTFFVVAHFHYVLIGGVVFPIFGGLYYWYPKITGLMLSERLGRWNFWLTFVGFNLTFLPMHSLGLLGMPRRVYTYPAELGLDSQNLTSTVGAMLLALGFLLFVVNVIRSVYHPTAAGANPWEADSLEWSVSSPPPDYGYQRPPIVLARHPLWSAEEAPPVGVSVAVNAMDSAPYRWRATLVTDAVSALPVAIQYLPGRSFAPLLAALGLLIGSVGVLSKSLPVAAAGFVFALGAFGAWLKPDETMQELLLTDDIERVSRVTTSPTGANSVAWWGMLGFIAVLSVIFATLFFSYFYLRLFSASWPQGDLAAPAWPLPLAATLVLTVSALPPWRVRLKITDAAPFRLYLASATGALGCLAFLALQGWAEFTGGIAPQLNGYATAHTTVSGFLWLVVACGAAIHGSNLLALRKASGPRFRFAVVRLEVGALYSLFLLLAAWVVFAVLYLTPRLM